MLFPWQAGGGSAAGGLLPAAGQRGPIGKNGASHLPLWNETRKNADGGGLFIKEQHKKTLFRVAGARPRPIFKIARQGETVRCSKRTPESGEDGLGRQWGCFEAG